jgi:hypothetical protein
MEAIEKTSIPRYRIADAKQHGRWALRQACKSAARGMPRTASGYLEYADGIYSALFLITGESRPASYHRVAQATRNRESADIANELSISPRHREER